MASADTYQQITEAASKKGDKTVSVRVDPGVLKALDHKPYEPPYVGAKAFCWVGP
jgi:hypothetical protein